ncbi:MAG: hypothetical protein HYZ53_18900 [Planctomycetes bacterium]|nr:hypothetical protein [Planctomycetota bacterium]
MNAPVRALFLIQGPEQPASRYRVLQFEEFLRAGGVEPTVRDYPRSPLGWVRTLRGAHGHDLLFVQKKRLSAVPLWCVRRTGVPLVFDVDDAVMFASSRHASPDAPGRLARFRRMVMASRGVVVGNRYLRELVEPLNPRVWTVPTVMDLRKYRVRDAADGPEGDPLVLGWIGGRKSLPFLAALRPALDRLAARAGRRMLLRVVSREAVACARMPVELAPWTEAGEAGEAARFDVGLAPLPDDPWSRGKCATKLLQYMAAGVPAVASPVGAHCDIVRDGAAQK